MRIAVFAHSLKDAGGRSVGINLARSLPRIGSAHDFMIVAPADDDYTAASNRSNVVVIEVPNKSRFRRSWWEIVRAPALARAWGADWVISLGNVPMLRGARCRAVLLHDPHLFYPVSDLTHLSRSVRMRKMMARAFLRVALPRQTLTFTQTSVAADRVGDTYRIGRETIIVVPNALSALITSEETGTDPLDLALPSAGFRFLTLTKYGGRKGLETLVTMFERYSDRLSDVVGIFTVDVSKQERARALMARVSEADLGDHLINLGPIDQRMLRALYAGVDAVVLPSLLESFSGVYVEAMALGVPIITSDRDFAHVVCGDAAIYVDPTDPGAIAQAIARLASNPELRSDLVRKGRDRASRLGATWDDSAGTILSAIENASDG